MRRPEFLGVFCAVLLVFSQQAFICRRQTSIAVSSGREQGTVACCNEPIQILKKDFGPCTCTLTAV